ncbi:hypothetical protein N9O60_00510, partial [Gammaproteobacteria bacterium]|nr:hypothetical protein [Gammaproteobacteria bacterium]
ARQSGIAVTNCVYSLANRAESKRETGLLGILAILGPITLENISKAMRSGDYSQNDVDDFCATASNWR